MSDINETASRIASRYDVSRLGVELLLKSDYDEATVERLIESGLEQGKIKTNDDYELEALFGLHNSK